MHANKGCYWVGSEEISLRVECKFVEFNLLINVI